MRDAWNLMDALLLGLMYVDVLFSTFEGNPGRTLRPLRALRPLRVRHVPSFPRVFSVSSFVSDAHFRSSFGQMINRNESMKLVLDLFFRSLPMIFHVVVLTLIFFLIMSILGTYSGEDTRHEIHQFTPVSGAIYGVYILE